MLMLDSGQRCGAAANLTMDEFENGEWTTVDGEQLYITQTVVHETQSDGPAKLFWDKDLKNLVDIYVDKMRPLFQNSYSLLPERPGVPPAPALFIAVSGNYLTESRISNRLAVMGKKLNPSMPGTLKGSRIRKGIISSQRDMGETSEISRECTNDSRGENCRQILQCAGHNIERCAGHKVYTEGDRKGWRE